MEQEKEFEQYLGGAPREAVTEFKKPGELSEDELMGVMSGPNRQAVVEKQFENESLFRQSSVEAEKEAMFRELEQSSRETTQSNTHTM